MSKAEMMYMEGGGCYCHLYPHCDFCMALTEEESTIFWNSGSTGLKKYWKEHKDESQGTDS